MDALAWIIATTLIVLMIRLRVFGHREFGLFHQFVRRQAENLAQSILSQKSFPLHPIDSDAGVETAEKIRGDPNRSTRMRAAKRPKNDPGRRLVPTA